MNKLLPLILEPDEELSKDEEMIDIRTIGVNECGKSSLGYIAVIRSRNDHLNIRYGNLRARKYNGLRINKTVL